MTNGSEVRKLLDSLCDETITPEQMGRLEELILSDPAAEALYIEYMQMHAGFLREFGGASTAPGTEDETTGPDPGMLAGEVKNRHAGSASPSRWPHVLSHVVKWGGWAAALFLVAMFAPLGPWGRRNGPVAVAPSASLPPLASARAPASAPAPSPIPVSVPAPASKVAPEEGLAVVVEIAGVEWEPSQARRPTLGNVVPAGRLRFRSGRVTLAFLNGILLTLEGPADLDVKSIDRVFCHQGKLRAQVPEGAEGFMVSSKARTWSTSGPSSE